MADNSLERPQKCCSRCKEVRPITDFYKKRNGIVASECKACRRIANQKLLTERKAYELAGRQRCVLEPFGEYEEGYKICTACAERKPISEFYPQKGRSQGVRSHCIECMKMARTQTVRKASIRYYYKNRIKRQAARHVYYEQTRERTKRNDSIRHRAKREKKWAAMGATPRPDRCEICLTEKHQLGGRHRVLLVDHCHITGKFRGWLCDRCNRTLGIVEDDPALLRRMAEYLETHHALHQKTGSLSSQ